MKGNIEERVLDLADYIVASKATVRQAAAKFGISKSTVHKDVTERLEHMDRRLYNAVSIVLQMNKNERHIRGGEATRTKYKKGK